MHNSRLFRAVAFCCGLLTSSWACAHTPFLAPVSFEPAHDQWVSLDAGFAEVFFQSDVAFDNGKFQVLTPSDQWQSPTRYEEFKTRSLVEYQLKEKGTYRFTTGSRLGSVFRFYELNGQRKATRDANEVLPEGAKLVDHYQSVTLAETYITYDKPTTSALKPYGKGLEIVSITHPSDIYAGDKFALKILFDGKPVAGKEVSVFIAQDGNEHEKASAKATTNNQGEAEFAFAGQGVYLLYVRHTAPAPKGAEAPNYGYIYTLSFAVHPKI